MDINRENYDLGRPIIEKAGVAHKIDFREGPALPVLDQLVEDVSFCAVLHVTCRLIHGTVHNTKKLLMFCAGEESWII